ncbi:MAG: ATP-dependent RecD-like DNA helicase [Sinobacteraceae bacterium]|nr:ATP-dependent RecD-like DNA helicase [Nevskiaceae bacterium]
MDARSAQDSKTAPVTEIVGTVDRVQVFGDWGVAFLRDAGSSQPPRIVGARVAQGALVRGVRYRIVGRPLVHPKYGDQIEAERISEAVETRDAQGLVRHLCRTLDGVGPVTAQKIVDWYAARDGLESLRQHIESEPDRLASLPFLTSSQREVLTNRAVAGAGQAASLLFATRLAGAGLIPAPLISAVAERYLKLAIKLGVSHAGTPGGLPGYAWGEFARNPYQLVGMLRGYGFRMADLAGRYLGFALDDPKRLAALGSYTLAQGCEGYGHVYLGEREFSDELRKQAPGTDPKFVLDLLRANPRLAVHEDGRWYPPAHWHAELSVSERLRELLNGDPLCPASSADIDQAITDCEGKAGLPLSEEQRQALRNILLSPKRLHTLTAGPGCGKTAVVEVLSLALVQLGFPNASIGFCAPTGKAAKVLSARIAKHGCFGDAVTVHRLLEAGPEGFGRNRTNPLEQRLIVADESSMKDIMLMAALLDALGPGAHLLMIGDPGQLPSVGAGTVLADVLRLPADHQRLTQVFRNQGSLLEYIHAVGRGEPPRALSGDAVVLAGEPENIEQVVEAWIAAVERQRRIAPDENPLSRALLLCPRRKGKREEPGWNTTYLNAVLQDRLNPNGTRIAGSIFRVGDRVILRENAALPSADDPDTGIPVCNGDTGFILEGGLVELDSGEIVKPPRTYFRDSVQLAYALTVHVSQGSEYPEVILVQKEASPVLANRELIFTAASRAKSKLTVFGDPRLIERACQRRAARRNSWLVQRVMGAQSS